MKEMFVLDVMQWRHNVQLPRAWCRGHYVLYMLYEITFKLKFKLMYFLISATSSIPLALYNGTHTLVWIQWAHTYTYTVKYSTHTFDAMLHLRIVYCFPSPCTTDVIRPRNTRLWLQFWSLHSLKFMVCNPSWFDQTETQFSNLNEMYKTFPVYCAP